MYIDIVPNRDSPPAILLRESYREAGKVKKRTLANLSCLSIEQAHAFRAILKGGESIGELEGAFEIVRSLPYGHVAAVLATAKQLGVPRLLAYRSSRERDLVVAMIVARVVGADSKLATARALNAQTASHSLGQLLELGTVDEDELYSAMDWLVERQPAVEEKLAKKHLEDGTLVLYDVTSTYFEGRSCELACFGYSRDGKKKPQIVVGLLCNRHGCPVAVEVFSGNTADPTTLSSQVAKVTKRFKLNRVVFVGDRGMLTSARIREELQPIEGLDWISALRGPQIKKLAADEGPLQPSLFDHTDHVEIAHDDFPGERLIACRNPRLAAERRRKREVLLRATEKRLEAIVEATRRSSRRLTGDDKIGERVGRVFGRSKVAKHFTWEIDDQGHFSFQRDHDKIAQEAALDGVYIIRTSVSADDISSEQTVAAYKGLAVVERAFRRMKTVSLDIRPVYHRLEDRVRAHVFLCMLSYYVEWHMRQRLAPVLFQDHTDETKRESVVAPAQRSEAAKRKARRKRTDDGLPVHSFRTLLMDLGTIVRNQIQPNGPNAKPFYHLTRPTAFQIRVFELLGAKLNM